MRAQIEGLRAQMEGLRRVVLPVSLRIVVALILVLAMTGCGLEQMSFRGSPWGQEPAVATLPAGGPSEAPEAPLRVFWVNSYAVDDPWALQIRTGLWESLARAGYSVASGTLLWDAYDLQVSSVSSETDLASRAVAALAALGAFDPDVVVVSDDEAVEAIVPELVQGRYTIIACGLTSASGIPSLRRDDVAVVVEPLRPEQTVALAQAFTDATGGYAVLGDNSMSGQRMLQGVQDVLVSERSAGDVQMDTAATWEVWKSRALAGGTDGAFVLVSSYRPLPDAGGNLISEREMMAWMLRHLDVPVFSLSNTLVINGAVGGLVADGYEQGRLAGELAIATARGERDTGASLTRGGMELAGPSRLVMNAAAARHSGLQVPALFPIAAEIYKSLPSLPPTTRGTLHRAPLGELLDATQAGGNEHSQGSSLHGSAGAVGYAARANGSGAPLMVGGQL